MCNISVKVSFSFQYFKHLIFGNSSIESVIDYVVSNKGNENVLKSIGNQLKDTDFIQVTVWDKNGNKYDSEVFTIQAMKNQFIAQKMVNEK